MYTCVIAALRKNKWKSLEDDLTDSPGDLSENCRSSGCYKSDGSLLVSSEVPQTTHVFLEDDGYMCMNFNSEEGIKKELLARNSTYVLFDPDSAVTKDREVQDKSMDMSPGVQLDCKVLNTDRNSMTGVTEGCPESRQDLISAINADRNSMTGLTEDCHFEQKEQRNSVEYDAVRNSVFAVDAQKDAFERSEASQMLQGDIEKHSSGSPLPTTPEKRAISKLRDFKKQMTMNWKPKKDASPIKKKQNEATSHFYVDTLPVCPLEEGLGIETKPNPNPKSRDTKIYENNMIAEFISNRKTELRPDLLDLKSKHSDDAMIDRLSLAAENAETKRERGDEKIDNIYANLTVDNADRNSVLGELSESDKPEQVQQNRCKQQNKKFDGNNDQALYTNVVLKGRTNEEMPVGKGQYSHRINYEKIPSSPTSNEGYENILLQSGLSGIPLDGAEERCNADLEPPATGKGQKTNAEQRRSAEDAAMQQLLALRNGNKERDAHKRSKSAGDRCIQEGDGDNIGSVNFKEAAYVNVNIREKRNDASIDVNVEAIFPSDSRQSISSDQECDTIGYTNVSNFEQSRNSPIINSVAALDSLPDEMNLNNIKNKGVIQRIQQSPASKPKSRKNDVYSTIDENYNQTKEAQKIQVDFSRLKLGDRPIPAPRPKKEERRKAMKENSDAAKPVSPRKQHYCQSPQLEEGDRAISYENVGRYRDDFDAIQPSQISLLKMSSKSRSYKNLVDEYPARRKKKKPVDLNLAYAQVELLGSSKNQKGESEHSAYFDDNCEGRYADIDPFKRSDNFVGCRNSPQLEQDSSHRGQHYAYSQVDFMKSQGIKEAVRERRAGSLGSSEQDSKW